MQTRIVQTINERLADLRVEITRRGRWLEQNATLTDKARKQMELDRSGLQGRYDAYEELLALLCEYSGFTSRDAKADLVRYLLKELDYHERNMSRSLERIVKLKQRLEGAL